MRRENIELTKALKHCKEQLQQEFNQLLLIQQKYKDLKSKLRQCRNEKLTATNMVREGNKHIDHLQGQVDSLHTQIQNLCAQIKDLGISQLNT